MHQVFICDYQRTPIGRYGGALASVRTDDLAAIPIRALMERHPAIDPQDVDEVVLGCANQAGEDNRNVARMASLLAGLPQSVPAYTVNRLCASGMDAVIAAARTIKTGEADLVLAGGVESMSRAPFVMAKSEHAFSRQAEIFDTTIGWRFINPKLDQKYGTDSMPETAENLIADYAISREAQDEFAMASQNKASQAIRSGRMAEEICPVEIPQRRGEPVVVDHDEHPRETTLEKLASLKAPFREGGTVTAGNAAGVNDGAACLILASEAALERHGLTPLAEITGTTSAGVAPRIMGIGPVPAIKKLLTRQKASLKEFDVLEINEAFAGQVLAVLKDLDLDPDDPRLNPNGGAIALGHPLGMTGARLVGSAALQLQNTSAKQALCSLCVGVGQGVAVSVRHP